MEAHMNTDKIFDKNGIVHNPYTNRVCEFCFNGVRENGNLLCQLWLDCERGSERQAVEASKLKSCSPQEYRLDLNGIFTALKGEST